MKNNLNLEKVPLFVMFKEGNKIKSKISEDSNMYEVYGYLKNYVEHLDEQLFIEQYTEAEVLDK